MSQLFARALCVAAVGIAAAFPLNVLANGSGASNAPGPADASSCPAATGSAGPGPTPPPMAPGTAPGMPPGAMPAAPPCMRGPHSMGERAGFEMPLPPYLRGVDLNATQRQKIAEIMHAAAAQFDEAARSLHDAHRNLIALALSDRFSDKDAQLIADGAASAGARMAAAQAHTDHDIYLLLTPAQQKEVSDALAHPVHPHGPGDGEHPGGH